MSTLDDWLAGSAVALELPPTPIDPALRAQLLELTREVAHGVTRVGGPLTCYLVGIAVGRGADPAAAVAAVRQLSAHLEGAHE